MYHDDIWEGLGRAPSVTGKGRDGACSGFWADSTRIIPSPLASLTADSQTTESVAGDEPRRGEMNQEWEEEGQRGRESRSEGGGGDAEVGRG